MENTFHHSVTGVVLAGGKSRRMGRDKAFIPIDGLPMVERIIGLFAGRFAAVLVIGGEAERFAGYNVRHHPDIYPGCALGGLYTGLYVAETPYIFVSACDIPYPSGMVMDHLLSLRHGFDAVVAESDNALQPLFAIYGKGCQEAMRLQLEDGNPCILDLFPRITTRTVTPAELASIAGADRCFCNLNTPEDMQQLQIKQ
ncbi:molybdenum cofactor guanylyltransferase [Geotalea toluenoxydans]